MAWRRPAQIDCAYSLVTQATQREAAYRAGLSERQQFTAFASQKCAAGNLRKGSKAKSPRHSWNDGCRLHVPRRSTSKLLSARASATLVGFALKEKLGLHIRAAPSPIVNLNQAFHYSCRGLTKRSALRAATEVGLQRLRARPARGRF
jgi:hypothetical protein